MNHETAIESLSDYIDGELDSNREELSAHLEVCAPCRTIVADLRMLRREARALGRVGAVAPPERVWKSISRELGRDSSTTGSHSKSHVLLAAAAVVLLGVGLWATLRTTAPDRMGERELTERVGDDLRQAEAHYQSAISGLEELIANNEGALPDNLRKTLDENLDLIEGSIEESRTAMATEPGSGVAQESLLEAFQRKLSLLKSMVRLINEVRKGEGANALELIDEIQRTENPSNPI